MTHLGDHELPRQPPDRRTPRWLVFAVTALVFSIPVAGVPLMAWPLLLQHTNIVIGHVELIGLAGVVLLIGGSLASYALREQRPRL